MPRVFVLAVCLSIFAMLSGIGWGQQAHPSCEEQLDQVQMTLMFTRAGRNGGEDNAGRVVGALQKQVKSLEHEIEALKRAKVPEISKDEEKKTP